MPDRGFLKDAGFDPGSPAVFDGNNLRWLTRAELTQRVTAFAEHLQFPRKALVFLFAWNDLESLIAYLAALQAGHAVAMLNPELDEALAANLIGRFEPDFIVRSGAAQLVRSAEASRRDIHPDLSLLISTSGSTGSPKLVRLAWRNLESNARQIIEAVRHTERDRTMISAPIFNGYGQSVIHTMLLAGGSLALSRARVFSQEFWDAARQAECNVTGGTPFFYQTLERLDLDSLNVPLITKFVQIGGRMPPHLAEKFHAIARARGGELHLMYGQAEATARISGLPPQLLPEACRSIGFVLPGGRLRIENEGCECAPMEEGELVYEGPNVMMGYATCANDLAKGDQMGSRVATGDLGYRDEGGLFYITGRRSRFVKLFGWRVSLDEVEQLLSHAAPVAAVNEGDRLVIYAERPDAAAAVNEPRPHSRFGEQGSGTALEEAVDELARKLNLHRSGFEIRTVDAIPRLANSKINYQSLTR